jgi:hypothetical protein
VEKNQNNRRIWFPRWMQTLDKTTTAPEQRESYRHAIIAYLALCRAKRVSVCIALARTFITERSAALQASDLQELSKQALNWFFRVLVVKIPPTAVLSGHAHKPFSEYRLIRGSVQNPCLTVLDSLTLSAKDRVCTITRSDSRLLA